MASTAEPQSGPILMSVKEVARTLSISPWSVYQLCEQKKLRSVYFGKRRLVDAESVKAFAGELPEEKADS